MDNDIVFGILVGLLFVSLIVIFCIVLLKLYIQKIKNYTTQLYQKDLDFQKTLTTTILETQEQVLHNISQDLHDDAGQQLTYINFQIENLKLDSPELRESLSPISESVSLLAQSVRGLSHSLNNQLVSQQDLLKSMETELQRLQRNSHIEISYTIEDENDKNFSPEEKIVIYRIFQEAVNNAFKHSGASSLRVSVSFAPNFTMTVRDNGNGFERKHKNSPSMGIQNMEQRAGMIDYRMEIDSEPGKGTAVILSQNA